MASLPRATFFFKDGNFGWSETHYGLSVTTLEGFLDQAVTLGKARVMILGQGPQLTDIRVSHDDVWRDSLVAPGIPFTLITPPGYNKDFSSQPSDLPYSVILLRCESGSLYRKSLYLSGCPDEIQVDPPPARMLPEWTRPFNAWRNILISGSWGFKVINRDTTVNPLKKITNILSVSPWTVTLPTHELATGDSVLIRTVKGTGNKPNGVFVVTVIDNNSFTLNGFTGPFVYLSGGLVQKRSYTVVPYTSVIVKGETHRKRGIPFGSPRGRSRAK